MKGFLFMDFKAPRGTFDILPDDSWKWQYVENIFRKLCFSYGYSEIRTPVFEHTELFTRGIGENTDIVEKEMYTFKDKKDRGLTLRPEWTAPVMRAIIENKLSFSPPIKLFYMGPIFRYERPQQGRYRQAHQLGVEVIGSHSPFIDVEVISLIVDFYKSLGLKGIAVSLNSIGCKDCRASLREKLVNFWKDKLSSFCENCRSRFERNPLRILDCKNKDCIELARDFPSILNFVCNPCREHFDTVTKYLDELNIPYKIENTLVRGLDYYTRTVFEVVSGELGAQNSLCGGGRYDDLIETLGGQPSPGVGFAAGIERAIIVLEKEGIFQSKTNKLDLMIIPLGESATGYGFKLATELRRKQSISVEISVSNKNLKSQLKLANKAGAAFCLIIGDREIELGEAIVKNMASGEQNTVSMNNILTYFKEINKEIN